MSVAETTSLGPVGTLDAGDRMDANYFFNACALPPGCEQLQRDLNAAAGRLVRKMQSIDLAAAQVGDFTRAYFGGKIVHAQSNFQRNTFVLAWALAPMLRWSPLSELTLIDYGGGTGDLSLLAKELGVGTVIYVDLFADFCRDAQHLAASMGLEAEHYVDGDVDALLAFCREKSIAPRGVVSFDVLEHIYDVDDFLRKIVHVSPGRLALSLASGANPLSPIVSHRLTQLQRSRELAGNPTKDLTEDPRDTDQPYLALRRQMVAAAGQNLAPAELDELASRTRGMRIEDVQRAVARYTETKQFPPRPKHPTNTCDPYTGNWCEQLLDPRELAHKLSAAGVPSKALAGYYGTGRIGSSAKRTLRLLANIAINNVGPLGLRAAPFYCVAGTREGGDGMNLPRVSIVTPSFNQAAFLEQTIRSVLDQDYAGEIDYIVMDGGSTDGSIEIIQRYEDDLASWTCERDEGQANAINRGFARASGTLFAWVNSDDLLAPSAVTLAVDAFNRLGEQVGVVYGDRLHIDARGNVIGINRMPAFYESMFRRNFTLPQETVFFRRDVFEAAGKLDESLRFSLDFDLWVRMAARSRVHHVSAFLGSFREHDASKSVNADRYLDEHATVYRKHFGRELPSPMRMRVNRLMHKARAAIERNSSSYRAEIARIGELTSSARARKELVTH